jgi:sulfatase maturation enzyme AslB (radical SAM superfamily)
MKSLSAMLSKTVCRIGGGVFDIVQHAFPDVVRIETTNACNANCTICPRRNIHRPITRLDDALYVRLIDECASSGCREIHLHNFGEPLMDKRLEDRVSYAKGKGIKKVKIFSNGSLLDCDRGKGLIDAGLDEIKISIDGSTKEEFERIRVPLKFESVMQNIIDLVAMRNASNSRLKINITCCSTSDKQATMQPLKDVVDGFSFSRIHNWGSDQRPSGRSRLRKPCARLWKNLTVLAGGEVSLCCLDYDGRHIMGRVDENTTIGDVWNSPSYLKVRQLHKQGRQNEILLCANCTKSFI